MHYCLSIVKSYLYTHTQNMPSSRQKEDSKKEQEEKKPKSRETAVSRDALSGY